MEQKYKSTKTGSKKTVNYTDDTREGLNRPTITLYIFRYFDIQAPYSAFSKACLCTCLCVCGVCVCVNVCTKSVQANCLGESSFDFEASGESPFPFPTEQETEQPAY